MQKVSLKKSYVSPLLLACLIGFALASGCTETPEVPAPTPEATPPAHTTHSPAGPQPSFSATVTALKKHFRTDMSCYWVATGMVTNTGDAPGRNVVIRFMLIDDETGMIRSTVGKKLGMKFTPTITFVPDTVPETAAEVEAALAKARAADAEVAQMASDAQYAGEADPYKTSSESEQE